MTLNEGMIWMKTLKERHAELVALRNENSATTRRYLGAHADKEVVREPTYDVKALDALVAGVAKEMRLLELAMKSTNAQTAIIGYTPNEDALGTVS